MPVLTRSKTKMWTARNDKHEKRVFGEWEDCYAVVCGVNDLVGKHPHLEHFRTGTINTPEGPIYYRTTYYQTFGGGSEGGYFVKEYKDLQGNSGLCGIYEVRRDWGKSFSTRDITRIGGGYISRLDYEYEDWTTGKTARVRHSYAPIQ